MNRRIVFFVLFVLLVVNMIGVPVTARAEGGSCINWHAEGKVNHIIFDLAGRQGIDFGDGSSTGASGIVDHDYAYNPGGKKDMKATSGDCVFTVTIDDTKAGRRALAKGQQPAAPEVKATVQAKSVQPVGKAQGASIQDGMIYVIYPDATVPLPFYRGSAIKGVVAVSFIPGGQIAYQLVGGALFLTDRRATFNRPLGVTGTLISADKNAVNYIAVDGRNCAVSLRGISRGQTCK